MIAYIPFEERKDSLFVIRRKMQGYDRSIQPYFKHFLFVFVPLQKRDPPFRFRQQLFHLRNVDFIRIRAEPLLVIVESKAYHHRRYFFPLKMPQICVSVVFGRVVQSAQTERIIFKPAAQQPHRLVDHRRILPERLTIPFVQIFAFPERVCQIQRQRRPTSQRP